MTVILNGRWTAARINRAANDDATKPVMQDRNDATDHDERIPALKRN